MYSPPWPPSAETTGLHCESVFNPCGAGEFGCDVGLRAGTVIVAPFSARVLAWQPCGSGCGGTGGCPGHAFCWGCCSTSGCGRLVFGPGPTGEVIAFGHVKPLASGAVACGGRLAQVQGDACGGPHVEFQLAPSGAWAACSDYVQPSPYLAMLFSFPACTVTPPPKPRLAVPLSEALAVVAIVGGIGLVAYAEHRRTPGLFHDATGASVRGFAAGPGILSRKPVQAPRSPAPGQHEGFARGRR